MLLTRCLAVRRAFLALCQTVSNPTVSCAAGQFASTCYNRGVLSTCVSECMDCPVGTYADTPGATFCRTCAPGETTVVEPEATRDHTERMLCHFGATVRTETVEGGAGRITLVGQPELVAAEIVVPRDISSAAFPMVAGLITNEASISLPGVGVNPHRSGLLVTLREMGAKIGEANTRNVAGEPVADLLVTSGPLAGVTVPAARAP